MANLFTQNFSIVPSDRVYIQNKSQTIDYGEIQRSISEFKTKHPYLIGKNCALLASSRFELAKTIPLIAAVANKIFLQPQCLGGEVVKEFYFTGGIEYVVDVSDSGVNISKVAEVSTSSLDQGWLLSTSGTTGTPKLVSYNLASLMNTVKKSLEKGGSFSWGLSYDLNRFAGLQVYLQAIASGSSLTILESTDDFSSIVSLLKNKSVNCLSATPSFWRKILMTKSARTLPLKIITLGGEIADQVVIDSLGSNFLSAKVIHIYASTEAGVGFTVKDAKAGFPYSYVASAKLHPIELKIVNDVLWIKSNRAADELLNGSLGVDIEGFINTGDIVEIRDNRVLFVGRESGTINVGGNKVVPEEIESVLNSHSSVIQSKVFGKKSPILGMLVSAEVVASRRLEQGDRKLLKKELMVFCRGALAPFKVPAMLKFVDSIEVNESGKIARNK